MAFTLIDFSAGWLGGVAGLLVGHPWDTIKVRQQNLGLPLVDTIRTTYKYEGIIGFYKGLLFPLLTVGPVNSVFFGIYGNSMKAFQTSYEGRLDAKDPLLGRHSFFSGVIGGAAVAFINCPIELLKTIRQLETGGHSSSWNAHYIAPYSGLFDTIKGVYKNAGIPGFYRGNVTLMFRDIPTYGIYTLTYDKMEQTSLFNDHSKLLKHTITGGVAGITSWLFVLPLDVVKSRIQGDNPANPRYHGMIDTFKKLYGHYGFKIFYKGFTALFMRAFFVNAATFVCYEYAIELWHKLTDEN